MRKEGLFRDRVARFSLARCEVTSRAPAPLWRFRPGVPSQAEGAAVDDGGMCSLPGTALSWQMMSEVVVRLGEAVVLVLTSFKIALSCRLSIRQRRGTLADWG